MFGEIIIEDFFDEDFFFIFVFKMVVVIEDSGGDSF